MSTPHDDYQRELTATQTELGRLLRPFDVTAEELAGEPVLDPGRPQRQGDQRVTESNEEYLARVPEARGPQDLPDGYRSA